MSDAISDEAISSILAWHDLQKSDPSVRRLYAAMSAHERDVMGRVFQGGWDARRLINTGEQQ